MPARARKAVARKPANQNSLTIETRMVPINDLTMYHRNPRIGNPETTARSLNENGQYRPIVVNIGTLTGRPNEILAGNHTWLGARKELHYEVVVKGKKFARHKPAWTEIEATFIDVDDDRAAKIVLIDNKSADESEYDYSILDKMLEDMKDDLAGSGFTELDFEDIHTSVQRTLDKDLAELDVSMKQEQEAEQERVKAKTFDGSALGEEPDPGSEEQDAGDAGEVGPDVRNADDNLAGMHKLKTVAELDFDGVGYWGIPRLLPEKLMTWDELPEKLDSWAGSATKGYDDPDLWWLYNYGIDSTSGMQQPLNQIIVGFYAFDHYFENWWWYPERYTAKLLNSGIKFALTPNWSQSTEVPKSETLWQLYRSRYIGRYLQEAGLRIIPDVTWVDGDLEWLEKYVLATLPKKLPMIAMQLQTIDKGKVTGGIDHFQKQIERVFSYLQPEGALIYTGAQGKEMIGKCDTGETKIRVIGTRVQKLGEQASKRQKKNTL